MFKNGYGIFLGCYIEPADQSVIDRPRTRYVKCVPKCASVRVAPSNIVYYCTDIDPQGKVN